MNENNVNIWFQTVFGKCYEDFENVNSEEGKERQIKLVGSEAIYKRVNNKMAQLEADPLFFWEQLKIYIWRVKYIKKKLLSESLLNIDGLAIPQSFDQFLNGNIKAEEFNKEISAKSCRIFVSSLETILCLFFLDRNKTESYEEFPGNNGEHLQSLLRNNPIIAELAELAIQSTPLGFESPLTYSVRSLRETCKRRVLELELGQDCLPLTLRQGLARGPQLRRLVGREARMVERLHGLIKD